MKKIKNYIEYLFLLSVALVCKVLPIEYSLKLGKIIGILGFYLIKKRKEHVISNIKSVLNIDIKKAKEIAKRAYINCGKNIIEFLSFYKISNNYLKKYVKVEGEDLLREALMKKKGIINVVGHFGNWELMSVIYRLLGYPLTILVYKQHNKFTDRFINHYRSLHGTQILYRDTPYSELANVLKEGKMLGIVADQDAGKGGIFIDFLGRRASTAKGPVVLQRRTSAPLFFSVLIREDNHHLLKIFPVPTSKSNNPQADLVENTKRWSCILEKFIRDYPDQWFWAHQRYKTKQE